MPIAAPAPSSSGATSPAPAAAAFASLNAAGPAGPCAADSTTTLPVTTYEPNRPQTSAPASVTGSAGTRQ